MPQSLAPARAPAVVSSSSHAAVSSPLRAPVSAPAHAPLAAPVPSAFADDMREEDRTMIARSRFGDDTSVHEERTVIGQIPKEALEFERMFAQRTQPPPPDEKDDNAQKDSAETKDTARPPAPLPNAPGVPAFDSGSFGAAKAHPEDGDSEDSDSESSDSESSDNQESESSAADGSSSEPPSLGDKPSSDSRGLVTLAEATQPSVARSVSARRLRVTLITLLVIAVLVALFVIQMPR
jgi:hypothetical protein